MNNTTANTADAKHIRTIARVPGMKVDDTPAGVRWIEPDGMGYTGYVYAHSGAKCPWVFHFVAYAEAEAAKRGWDFEPYKAEDGWFIWAGLAPGAEFVTQEPFDKTDPHSTARAKLAALAEACEWLEANK